MKAKITVLTFNQRILTFTVDDYKVENGDFILFTDKKTGKIKQFHASRCEIEVIE